MRAEKYQTNCRRVHSVTIGVTSSVTITPTASTAVPSAFAKGTAAGSDRLCHGHCQRNES